MTNVSDFAAARSAVLETDDYLGTGVRVRYETHAPSTRRAIRAGYDLEAMDFNAFTRPASPSRRRRRRRHPVLFARDARCGSHLQMIRGGRG